MVKKYNISKPEKYQAKDGSEKTMWHNVGTMTEFHKQDGSVSRIIEIPAISLKANVFPFQDKKEFTKKAELPEINVDEEVSAADLPF